jgi:DNA repair exonuclease SbcCD nuclease subunit
MSILTVSDLHFHNYKNHSTIINNHNSRLLDIGTAFKEAVSIGLEHGVAALAIPGDVFHVRGRIETQVYNYVYSLFQKAAKDIPIILISGNHDLTNQSTSSALEPFGSIKNLYLLDNLNDPITINGYSFQGISYIHSNEYFRQEYENLPHTDFTLIHQGVDDFRPTNNIPPTQITATYLEEYQSGHILAGHYHTKGSSNRTLSPGSIIQHNFGDEHDEKGCWIIDEEMTFFPLTYPRFLTIDKLTKGDFSNSIVRVRAASAKHAEQLVKCAKDAQSVQVEVKKEYTTTHDKVVSIGSPLEMLAEYCELVEGYRDHKKQLVDLAAKVCV